VTGREYHYPFEGHRHVGGNPTLTKKINSLTSSFIAMGHGVFSVLARFKIDVPDEWVFNF